MYTVNVSIGVYCGEIGQKAIATDWFWDMLCSLCTFDHSSSLSGIHAYSNLGTTDSDQSKILWKIKLLLIEFWPCHWNSCSQFEYLKCTWNDKLSLCKMQFFLVCQITASIFRPQAKLDWMPYISIVCVIIYVIGHAIGPSEFTPTTTSVSLLAASQWIHSLSSFCYIPLWGMTIDLCCSSEILHYNARVSTRGCAFKWQ